MRGNPLHCLYACSEELLLPNDHSCPQSPSFLLVTCRVAQERARPNGCFKTARLGRGCVNLHYGAILGTIASFRVIMNSPIHHFDTRLSFVMILYPAKRKAINGNCYDHFA